MEMIQVCNLSVNYNHKQILKKISLTIKKGEFVLLIGANGSGKSIFMNTIAGIIPNILSGFEMLGDIKIDNEKFTKTSFSKIKTKIGMLMHNPEDQFIGLDVRQEISFGLNFINSNIEKEKYYNELIENFGLEDVINNSTSQLSLGQKQKVILATLLVKNPKILLLDEPSSFLDDSSLDWLIYKLSKLKERGITVILSTHNMKSFYPLATKLLAIKDGSISFYNSIGETTNEQLKGIYSLENYKVNLI